MSRVATSNTAILDVFAGAIAGGAVGAFAARALVSGADAIDLAAGAWASVVPGVVAGLCVWAARPIVRWIAASLPEPATRAAWAFAVAGAVSAMPVVAVLYLVMGKLRTIHEDDLAAATGAFATVLLVAGWLAASFGGAGLLLRARQRWRIDGFVERIRVARWSRPVGAMLAAVPVAALVLHFGQALSLALSPALLVLYLLALAAIRPGLAAVWRRLPSSGRRLLPGAAGGIVGLVLLSVLASGNLAKRARKAAFGRWTVAALRVLTDVDRDGASPLLGEGDCAPFDPGRNPMAFDVPGNGIDEDCDGEDRTASTAGEESGNPFSEAFPTDRVAKYNVVWIIIDAVRADATTLLDPDLPTTPYLARLARESLVFTHAYSQAPATMISIPSMLSGRTPGRITWRRVGGRMSPDENATMLAERLARAGYRTGIIVHSYFFNHFKGLFQGYDHRANLWLDGKMRPWYSRSSPIAATLSIEFIEDALRDEPSKPFFLTAYFEDPHHPYAPHDEGFSTSAEHARKNAKKFGIPGLRGEVVREKTAYLREVAFADRYVGFLLDYLRYRKDLWKKTIIVVTADHGEEFGEHGGRKHGWSCHEELVHVPLLVRIPGIEPQRIDATVALVDVVPTILEAVGLSDDGDGLDGISLLVHAFAKNRVVPDRAVTCTAVPNNPSLRDFALRGARTSRFFVQRDERTKKAEGFDRSVDPYEQEPLEPDELPDGIGRRLLETLDRTLEGNLVSDRLTR